MKEKPIEVAIELENGQGQNLPKIQQNFGENWTKSNFSAASALIITYILEISIQIYFLAKYFDVKSQKGQILLLGLFLTSIFVTFLSLFWVFRGLDFAGRFCARLVCYLIHSLLLGLIWRYLKLAFAYDHADLQEFFSLRFFQLFTQSIPLLSLQLAVIFTLTQSGIEIYVTLILSLLSICISLNILRNLKNSEKNQTHLKDLNKNLQNLENLQKSSVFNANLTKFCKFLSTTLLLTSRICVLSLIIVTIGHFGHFWTLLIAIVHCTVCFLWIIFCDKMYEKTNNCENFQITQFLYRVSQKVFIFFFDITHNYDGENAKSASVPIGLVVIENFAIYIYYTVFYTNFWSIFGLSIYTLGLVLFGISIFVQKNYNLDKILRQISSNLCNVEKKCVLPVEDQVIGDLSEKCVVLNGKSAWDLTMKRAIIKPNNYTNISEVLRSKLGKKDLPEMKNLEGTDPVSVEQLKIIQQAPKSPSDTCSSKNSSNDRNTNTLDSSTTDHNRQFLNLIQTHTNTNTNIKINQNLDDIDQVLDLDEDFVFFSPTKISVVRSTSPGKIRKITKVSEKSQKKSLDQMGHMSKSPKSRGVIINYPVKSKKNQNPGTTTASIRCSCQKNNENFVKTNGEKVLDQDQDQGYYEKLMESNYGILICEDSKIGQKKQNSKNSDISPIFYTNKKLKILCAKCYQNHDPLLSDCLSVENVQKLTKNAENLTENGGKLTNFGKCAKSDNSTTDYPSETEMTWTHNGVDDDEINDDLESYSSWPIIKGQKSGQNQDFKGQNQNFQGQNQNFKCQNQHLSGQNQNLEGQNQNLEGQNRNLSGQNQNLDGQNRNLEGQNRNLSGQNQNFKCQNQNLGQNMSIFETSTMLSDSKNSTKLFPQEFTGLEYVRTWLLTNQSRLRSKNHQFYPTLDQNFHHHNHQTNPRGRGKGQTSIFRSKTISSTTNNCVNISDFRKNVHFVPKIPKRLVGNKCRNSGRQICEPPKHKQHPTVDLNGILKTPIVNTNTNNDKVDSLKVAKMPTNLANKCVHCQCSNPNYANDDIFYKDIEFVV